MAAIRKTIVKKLKATSVVPPGHPRGGHRPPLLKITLLNDRLRTKTTKRKNSRGRAVEKYCQTGVDRSCSLRSSLFRLVARAKERFHVQHTAATVKTGLLLYGKWYGPVIQRQKCRVPIVIWRIFCRGVRQGAKKLKVVILEGAGRLGTAELVFSAN